MGALGPVDGLIIPSSSSDCISACTLSLSSLMGHGGVVVPVVIVSQLVPRLSPALWDTVV